MKVGFTQRRKGAKKFYGKCSVGCRLRFEMVYHQDWQGTFPWF